MKSASSDSRYSKPVYEAISSWQIYHFHDSSSTAAMRHYEIVQVSDGSIRFICLATAMLQPKPPSTIIFDEPELGLHPLAISVLAELIQNVSNRTQVIVATQSPALID